ncbi:MAG: hypothetical protein M1429_04485 [Patescibacteria group bacterium]|nr:hypothetical protein [Patescibacteria group bacterium]
MALEKNNLKAIEKMFDRFESKINKKIDDTRIELKKDIFNVEDKLTAKIEASENKIITVISREVNDLADINRAVITKIEEMDYRLRIVERKLGLKAH